MSGPRFATESPIAVRGSVLMVPLAAERDGDGWPSELTLSLDDGRELRGLVAWVHPAPPPARRRWTDDPRGLAVRAVVAGDDTSDAASGAAYLLAELPPETGSRLRLGQDSVTPRWRDPVGRAAAGEPLPLTEATDRPDPDSPFEYWRWVLLADRLDQAAPRPDAYGEIGSLVARHYADLWRVALDRLDRANPRVRQRCLDLLTGVGFDGPHAFGLWVIDPAEVGRLLALLLDDDRRDREVVISASNWADGPGLLAFRVAPRDPSKVALAVATPGEVPGEAHLSWLGSPTTVAEPVLLAPGQLQRLELEPPAAPAAPGTVDLGDRDPEVRVLVVEAAGRRQQMTFPTGAVPARPPGVLFTLRPTLTLADARSGWQRGLRDDRATNVQIRKLGRRWEVFVECLRPSPPAGAESEEKGSAPSRTNWAGAIFGRTSPVSA